MIDADDRLEVRRRANLHEVISEFVVLKRAGSQYKGCCPFHQEKTPSFSVNVEKGFYKCFGCNESGDVFAFVQKMKGLSFIDSVKYLADRYGVLLKETPEQKREFDKRSHLLMLHQQACDYYRQLLADPEVGGAARQYLDKRGITDDIIEKFKLGYAPHAWDGLLNYLTQTTNASPLTLLEAGLVKRKAESNHFYDFFRNRLMIPICDDQGRVIAFGGRTLGDDPAKYINSPDTPLYTKGQHLFAFHLAKDSIKAMDSVVVVEGYFDAITPHQFGFTNTVATCGTALTESQARSLVRYTDSKRVYLAFDADQAGERAIERGIETLNQIAEGIGLELRVVRVPGGKDPDECLRSESTDADHPTGPEAYRKAIEEAPLIIDYQLDQAFAQCDTSSHTGRIEAARKIVPILAQIKNAVGRGEYVRRWALKMGVKEDSLELDVGAFLRSHRPSGQHGQRPPRLPEKRHAANLLKSGYFEAEQGILALYLLSRDDYDRTMEAFSDWKLITPEHARIKEEIEGIGSQFNNVDDLQYKVMDRLGPEPQLSKLFVEIVLKVEEMRKQDAPIEKLTFEFKARLLKEKLTRALSRVRQLLATCENESDQEELQSRIRQLNQLDIVSLVSANTLEELEELRLKIDGVA